jgi:hypothetical protein
MSAPKSTPAEAAADNLLAGLRPAFAELLSELRALEFRLYLEGEGGAQILKCKGPRDPATRHGPAN